MSRQSIVAVLDTNVLISAWISPNSIPGILFKRFRNGDFEMVVSDHQLQEISNIASRPSVKKYISKKEADEGIKFLRSGELARILSPESKKWDFQDHKVEFPKKSRQYLSNSDISLFKLYRT